MNCSDQPHQHAIGAVSQQLEVPLVVEARGCARAAWPRASSGSRRQAAPGAAAAAARPGAEPRGRAVGGSRRSARSRLRSGSERKKPAARMASIVPSATSRNSASRSGVRLTPSLAAKWTSLIASPAGRRPSTDPLAQLVGDRVAEVRAHCGSLHTVYSTYGDPACATEKRGSGAGLPRRSTAPRLLLPIGDAGLHADARQHSPATV